MESKDIPDVQLKELIDTIHRDGVDKVRQESETLLIQARTQADAIVAAARAQAETLLANARQEQERLEQSGRESLKQASRDLLLKIKGQLQALFTALLREKSGAAILEKEMSAAIAAMISNWTPEQQNRIEILLPQKQFDAMAGPLRKALAAKIASGIEIKAAAELTSGFRVAEKDGQAFYDFSVESIAENLSLFLNPLMAKIVAESLQQDG